MRLTFEANNISEVRELHQMLTRLLAPEATPPKYTISGDSIDELPLSNRTSNALKNADIFTVSKLMSLKPYELSDITNLGNVGIREIKSVLQAVLK